ncbi:MAK10-like protein [Tanacetum coccineum]
MIITPPSLAYTTLQQLAIRHAIDHSAGGKLHDKSVEESWEIIKDLALYDNESWKDLRDFAKPVNAISLPQDVSSTSDRCLVELENQVINDQMTGALPSDTVKNPKLNLNPTSLVSSPCPILSIRPMLSKQPENALEDDFKDMHLNLPVLEVLAHAPIYNAILDKYVESLELGKNRSAFIESEMSKKMKNLELFILPCELEDSNPFNTLADLGSCVNLIPLYLFKMLNIRLLEETDNVLGLADGTKAYPVGIVRNVEVYVGKLELLEDFYVIDMEKDPTCPLLAGRGVLATASVVIDCKKFKIALGEGITRSIF